MRKGAMMAAGIGLSMVAGCATPVPQPPPVKVEMGVSDLPPEVRAAALAAEPGFVITEAEHELRNGVDYYDVGGTTAAGVEVEFDITRVDGVWTVVERQRDIKLAEVPEPVRAALFADGKDFAVNRVIESDQGAGVIIYEFFAPGPDGKPVKKEVKFEGGKAELLTAEWVH